jgi:hypothetical protein
MQVSTDRDEAYVRRVAVLDLNVTQDGAKIGLAGEKFPAIFTPDPTNPLCCERFELGRRQMNSRGNRREERPSASLSTCRSRRVAG